MSTQSPVRSSVEPDSFIDLADDCREVSSVLAPFIDLTGVIDLTKVPVPQQRPAFSIPVGGAALLDGYDSYGS